MKGYIFFPLSLCICLFLSIYNKTSFSQETTEQRYPFIKDETTSIKDPFDLRDPFKEETVRDTSKRGPASMAPAQGLKQMGPDDIKEIKDIKVVGVLLGNERRAMVSLNNEIITLSEGMRIGSEGLELKAIMPGGIVFVEKIKNIYEQEEYIETIVPISEVSSRN